MALMGQIYRQCSRARIWLGCNASECNLRCKDRDQRKIIEERNDPFKLIRLMEKHLSDWPCYVKLDDDKNLVRFEHTAAFDDLWQRHLAVSESPWWNRMWTVQESLLPPMASVMYDTWSMPFEDLIGYGDTAVLSHYARCCEDLLGLLPDEMRVKLVLQANQYGLLKDILDALRKPGETLSLTECLTHHGHRQCLDPRDKVYGVLGLIKGHTGLTKPDYSASLAAVFFNASYDMSRESRGLQHLIGFQYGPSSHKWASWVRDIDQQCTQHHNVVKMNQMAIVELFNASGSSNASRTSELWLTWPGSSDGKQGLTGLAVTGRCVGTIKAICKESCALAYRFAEAYSPFKSWLEIAGFDFEAHAAGRNTESNERIWRTMLCGVVRDRDASDASTFAWRRSRSDDTKLLDPFVAFAQTGVIPNLQEMNACARAIAMSTGLRTYFRSCDGGHGLCYPTSRPDDQVWVLHGATVPFVLRPVYVDTSIEANVLRPYDAFIRDKDRRAVGIKEGFEPRTGHYQLIGDCYYDGFMDGEALDDQKYPPQSILLV